MDDQYIVPSNILRSTTTTAGGTATTFVVNVNSGRQRCLSPTAGAVFRAVDQTLPLCDTGSSGPATDQSDRAEQVVRALMEEGWIMPRPPGSMRVPRAAAPTSVAANPAPWCVTAADVRTPDRLAAIIGILVALALEFLPPRRHALRRVMAVLHAIDRLGQRPAPVASVQRLLLAVHQAARWCPWQLACHRTSLSTVIAAAIRRERLEMQYGAATQPAGWHAWIRTTGGTPILAPGDRPITGVFTPYT